ncbi:putative tripartite motif-containing protein 45 [Apostichopus japonicus]|uniref:Putative tripartite motif-containing protein 45 n=1 Tax=Stichopus japonicus TaxID=307972 RepID=A0A2G8JT18_STIJA|nr:putative tripartite motif-containing protein 45 [Apostichopus japonicus]
MVNICGFCCQAHKRQKKTANHNVVSFLEARRRSYQQLQCPVHCPKHQQEELKFYCETCDYSVCRDCCLVEHREHLVEYVDDVGAHHKKNLVSKSPISTAASIQFKAKSSESNNLYIRGVISTCMADAGKSYADGEGLRRARVGEETIVSVTVLDDAGHLLGDGGDDIQADIYSVDDIKKKFQCYVQDRGDGTYKLSYCLKELGSYILNVRVSGHTSSTDSPFSLSVRTPWKSHTGMWHCCTFCSSEGNKDVTCACGGTMPGGFRGCGHNHIGHPGSWHWSCCASLDQDSVCSSKEPIIRSASQDNIVSMKGRLQRRATLAHADRIRMLQQHQQGMVGSVRSDKPLRVRDHSPRRLRDPSPMRARDPSPMRVRDPSPMRFRDPSPMRFRDPSPMRSDTVDRYQYNQSQYAHSATGSPSLNIDARSWKNVSF